jgi:hypothetical protein
MTDAIVLTKIEKDTFKPEKLAPEEKIDKSMNMNKVILCSKACDGTYHKVNSKVGQILTDHRTTLTNGGFQAVISKFFDEDLHGQRFLVYPNGKKALLIGNLFFGLKKISKL